MLPHLTKQTSSAYTTIDELLAALPANLEDTLRYPASENGSASDDPSSTSATDEDPELVFQLNADADEYNQSSPATTSYILPFRSVILKAFSGA